MTSSCKTSTAASAEDRERQIASFLLEAGWADAERVVLAQDASYRTYDRLTRADGQDRAVLMNAPPGLEDVRPYLDVAEQLHRFGYSAPRILDRDVEAGLLLIEDFGDRTFTRILHEPGGGSWDETRLYELAVDLLADLHRRAPAIRFERPPYDAGRLVEEADRLLRWYLPLHTGQLPTPAMTETFAGLWRGHAGRMIFSVPTLVLRDFHVDNLMVLEGRTGLARCGLLDFQDALAGRPPMIWCRCFRTRAGTRPPVLKRPCWIAIARRWSGPRVGSAIGPRSCGPITRLAHSALKIVGVFGRQLGFFGRTQYLRYLPRCWDHAIRDLEKAGMTDVLDWLDREIPPALRDLPDEAARLPAALDPAIPV